MKIAYKDETINNDAILLFMILSTANITLWKKEPMAKINKQIKSILIYGNKLFLMSKNAFFKEIKEVQDLFVANMQTKAGEKVKNMIKNEKNNIVSIDL